MATQNEELRPWPALWALVLGFFMILVDSTIVSIATPAIMTELDADVSSVVWVTSAYLLAYAVPLLITGRLGDRIGPRTLYLTGLAVFTVASVWCGLTGTIEQLIIAGLVMLAIFLAWRAVNPAEPLLPLTLFRDRNFSLANTAITSIGFAITAMVFPLMLYAQAVRGLSPTRAALLLVPMAVINGALSAFVGKLTDRTHPRIIAGFGLSYFVLSLAWLSRAMTPDVPIWQLMLPIALLGVANAFMWAPVGSTATRNLPPARRAPARACTTLPGRSAPSSAARASRR